MGGTISFIDTLVNLVKYARKKRAKAKNSTPSSSPQDGWGAMILEQAGPSRGEPIVPKNRVELGRSK